MWFAAVLTFESDVSGSAESPPLCEESIRLISADNESEARQKAISVGENGEHEYANSDGATVRWRFVGIIEVQDLCEPELYDGIEVHSRLFWKGEARGDAGEAAASR